jgi:ribA/ribD-fused uncharacterized protein
MNDAVLVVEAFQNPREICRHPNGAQIDMRMERARLTSSGSINMFHNNRRSGVVVFYGKACYLSTYFEGFPFRYRGKTFPTSEHLFQYQKAQLFKDRQARREIMETESPEEARQIGRQVKNFDLNEWKRMRVQYLFIACIGKFIEHPHLAIKLASGGPCNFWYGGPDITYGTGK